METAIDEIKLLKWAKNSDPDDPNRNKTVLLLDDFCVKSINGTHICMVFEVLGISLLQLIVQNGYQGIPLPMVRSVVRQVNNLYYSKPHRYYYYFNDYPFLSQILEGLDYLHTKCKIIHTDVKPENILLVPDSSYIEKLAAEARQWHSMGVQLPKSFGKIRFINNNKQ